MWPPPKGTQLLRSGLGCQSVYFKASSHGSQVPLLLASSNMKTKSQLLNLKKSFKYDSLSSKSDLDYNYAKIFLGIRSSFLLQQTLKCCHVRHPCHNWVLCEAALVPTARSGAKNSYHFSSNSSFLFSSLTPYRLPLATT